MPPGGSLLAYLDVPNDCKDALSLMNLELPHFVKFMKRIMKKLDKGDEFADIPLTREENGVVIASDYYLTCSRDTPNSDVLFARLPTVDGGFDICHLSFIRLAVRKRNPKNEEKPCNSPILASSTQTNILDNTLKQFSLKLDSIDSAIKSLINSEHKTTESPSIGTSKAKSSKPTATQPKVSTPAQSKTVTAAQSKATAATPSTPSHSETAVGTNASKTTPTPTKSVVKPAVTPSGPTPGIKAVTPANHTDALPKPVKSPKTTPMAPTPQIQSLEPVKKPTTPVPYIPNDPFLKSLDLTIDSVLQMVHKHQDLHFSDIIFRGAFPHDIIRSPQPQMATPNHVVDDGPSVDVDANNIHVTFADLPNHLLNNAVVEQLPKKSKKRRRTEVIDQPTDIVLLDNQDDQAAPIKRIHRASDHESKLAKDKHSNETKVPWYYGLIDTVDVTESSSVVDTSIEQPKVKKHKHKHKKQKHEADG